MAGVQIPQSMLKIGCKMPPKGRMRLMIGSEGTERTGKSHFACTSPGPIGWLNYDMGAEGVVDRLQAEMNKVIGFIDVIVPVIGQQAEYLNIFKKQAAKPLDDMIACPDIRTIVIDTGSDHWELMRLAEFGKLNPRGDVKNMYFPLNQLYRSMVRKIFDSGKNCIITHKVTEEYKDEKPTGKYKRSGFKETGYLIQANIEHLRRMTEGVVEFGIRVKDCRQNMALAGMELWGDECNFPTLAQYVFPESSAEEWV